MVNQADRPLVKVTLNLYQDDVEFFKTFFSSNYSEHIRAAVSAFVGNYKAAMEDNDE